MLEAARGHQPWARKAPAGPDHSVETRNAKRRIAAGRKGRADLRAPKRKKLKRFQNGKSNRGVPFSLSPEPKMTFMRQSYCFVATPNAADKGRRPPAPRIPNQDGFPFWESLLRLGSISPFQAQKRPRPQTSAAKLSHLRGVLVGRVSATAEERRGVGNGPQAAHQARSQGPSRFSGSPLHRFRGRTDRATGSACERTFRTMTFLTFKNMFCKILRHRIYSLVSLCCWARRAGLVGRG